MSKEQEPRSDNLNGEKPIPEKVGAPGKQEPETIPNPPTQENPVAKANIPKSELEKPVKPKPTRRTFLKKAAMAVGGTAAAAAGLVATVESLPDPEHPKNTTAETLKAKISFNFENKVGELQETDVVALGFKIPASKNDRGANQILEQELDNFYREALEAAFAAQKPVFIVGPTIRKGRNWEERKKLALQIVETAIGLALSAYVVAKKIDGPSGKPTRREFFKKAANSAAAIAGIHLLTPAAEDILRNFESSRYLADAFHKINHLIHPELTPNETKKEENSRIAGQLERITDLMHGAPDNKVRISAYLSPRQADIAEEWKNPEVAPSEPKKKKENRIRRAVGFVLGQTNKEENPIIRITLKRTPDGRMTPKVDFIEK